MSLLRVVWRTAWLQLRMLVAVPISYAQVLIQPVVYGGVGMALYALGGHPQHLAFAILGGGLVGLWSVTLFDAAYALQVERWAGTLEQLFGCPVPLAAVIAGKVLAATLLGLISFAVNLLLGAVLFHHVFRHLDPAPFAVSACLTLLAFVVMSMVIAPLFAWSRVAGGLVNGLETPAYLLCGFMFPVAILAGWVQPLAALLPPTWTIRGLYAALGEPVGRPDYPAWWAFALGAIAGYGLLSWTLFRLVHVRARRTGQLGAA